MVERLKEAVEKARAQRSAATPPAASLGQPGAEEASATAPEAPPASPAWDDLLDISLDPDALSANRIMTHDKSDPAHIPFDRLRTRLLKAFRDHGWKRLGITSPSKGCGKTMVSANLAFSFAQSREISTILLDLDLRAPALATTLGYEGRCPIEWFLTGDTPPEAYFRKALPNLALGLNTERLRDAAERVQSDRTATTLDQMMRTYKPDLVIYDMPPMLSTDDVLGFFPNLDAVLLVAACGQTTAKEIEECERLMADQTHFLGVMLNKAPVNTIEAYEYGAD